MVNSYEGSRFPRDFDDLPRFGGVSRLIGIGVIIIILALIVGTLSIVQVPPGTRGVLVTLGKVEDRILGEGLNFKNPITQTVIFMDVQIQKAESTESTATADLQEVSATVAVNYRLDPINVNLIYQTLRKDYVARVIKPNIEESLKATTATYIAEELVTRRAEVKATFDDILEERLRVFNIDVVSVSLTDFQFSGSFAAAIEAKVTAEQEALQAKNVLEQIRYEAQQQIIHLEQIRYEAQQQIIQAEAEKNATIARALGEGQAQIIEANAKAEAIQLITSQMTDQYALYLWLNQWDGKLPLVMTSDEQGIIIDIKSLLTPSETP
jgi:regulator of protease activity HflC (stomatin/prohibitin superfamily)